MQLPRAPPDLSRLPPGLGGVRGAVRYGLPVGARLVGKQSLGFEADPRPVMPERYGLPPASSVTSFICWPVSATPSCPAQVDGVHLGPATMPSPPRK
jgi:hypothetical protein